MNTSPPEAWTATIDSGLEAANSLAAPLYQVQSVRLALHEPDLVLGGVLGRTWGACAEVQQLWVHPDHRRQGLATRLMLAFEAEALARGCKLAYLETWSFQAPDLYRSLGYHVHYQIEGFGPSISKLHLQKDLHAVL